MKENEQGTGSRLSTLMQRVRELLGLYADNVRLNLSEKLTQLFSATVVLFLCLVLGVFTLAFLSGACIELLSYVMPLWACYAVLGGFFVVLIVMVILLKKALIVNPIARFVSRLLFERSDSINGHEDICDEGADELGV